MKLTNESKELRSRTAGMRIINVTNENTEVAPNLTHFYINKIVHKLVFFQAVL